MFIVCYTHERINNLKDIALTIVKMSTPPRETIQKQIQQDWANREYIEVITGSIKKITDFLNSFGELDDTLI